MHVDISPIPAGLLDDPAFAGWLGRVEPEWFRDYLLPTPKARQSYFKSRVRALINRTDAAVMLAMVQNRPAAVFCLERQAWDTAHFGFGCGRMSPFCLDPDLGEECNNAVIEVCLDRAVGWASAFGLRLFQRRLLSRRVAEIRFLEGKGFYLADNVVVTLRAEKSESVEKPGPSAVSIRKGLPEDSETVQRMARGAFEHSRFLMDPIFGRERGNEVYVKWLDNALSGLTHPGVGGVSLLLAETQDQPAGFLLFRVEPQNDFIEKPMAEIELVAVRPEHRGQGLGSALIRRMAEICTEQGVTLLEATTWMQDRSALGLYQSQGFRVVENLFTFHKRIDIQ